MAKALPLSTAPMEAVTAEALPTGDAWQFEPKWDGFRCLAFLRGGEATLVSKSGKPLGRYFPEMVAALAGLPDCVLDGELVIPLDGRLSFEALQLRLHPAESRVTRLAEETPGMMILFDCLESAGIRRVEQPLDTRRAALEAIIEKHPRDLLRLSPMTFSRATAQRWLARSGGAVDGVIAKRRDGPYRPSERAMVKVKPHRTADCVVGGFRYATRSELVGSLLLGLYDEANRLHHVGFTSGFARLDREALTRELEALVAPPGFTGAAPGGPSRWSNARSASWQPLKPRLVAEVRFDHVSGRRFRHGTAFIRWRPDKAPSQCTFDQIAPAKPVALIERTLKAVA